jgi:hypothetical protein
MAVPAIHPGEHLAEELKELDMSAAALARKLKVPTNRITGILNSRLLPLCQIRHLICEPANLVWRSLLRQF